MSKPDGRHHLRKFTIGLEQWRVTPAFAPVFEQVFRQGLAPLLPRARLLKQGSRKEVYLLTNAAASGEKNYYIKIYRHRGLLNRIRSLVARPRGLHEFFVGLAISARGIPAMTPCAGGLERRSGAAVASYFITEEIAQAKNLAAILLGELSDISFSPSDRFAVVRRLAALIRHMHERGVFQEDLALNNFLVGTGERNWGALYLIDFERIAIRAAVSPARQEWVLSKLNRVGREISLSQRLRFLHALHPDMTRPEIKTSAKKIDAATTSRLKQDVLLRSANTHTSVGYRNFDETAYRGSIRTSVDLQEAMTLISHDERAETPRVRVTGHTAPLSRKPDSVRVLRFSDYADAEHYWKLLWGLKTGRLPLPAPVSLIRSKRMPERAWIVMPMPDDSRSLADLVRTATDSAQWCALQRLAAAIIRRLHQLGVSAKNLPPEAFLITQGQRGRPCLQLAGVEHLTIAGRLTHSQAQQELAAIEALFSPPA